MIEDTSMWTHIASNWCTLTYNGAELIALIEQHTLVVIHINLQYLREHGHASHSIASIRIDSKIASEICGLTTSSLVCSTPSVQCIDRSSIASDNSRPAYTEPRCLLRL